MPSSSDIIAGTFTGLQLIRYENGNFKPIAKIDGLYESLGNLARDNNNAIWATHPYRGIYKIFLSADRKKVTRYTQYTQRTTDLPSVLNNHVYFIKNKIIVAAEKGVYEYDEAKNKFSPSAFFRPIFGDASVEYLTDDALGNTWFISDQRVGVDRLFWQTHAAMPVYSVIYFPELTGQMEKGAEYIYPYNMENVFIGSSDGVFHLNYSKYVAEDFGA